MREIRYLLICAVFFLLLGCASNTNQAQAQEDKKVRQQTAKVNVQLGIAYLEQDDVPRAKQKLLMALNQGPEIPETWYAMAYFLEATDDMQSARAHYLKAISLAPKRGDVHNNFGTFLCRTGKYRESISHFILAAKDPDYLNSSNAFENAGLCASKIPNKKLAIYYYNKAIAHDPHRPTSLFELSRLSYQTKDYKTAMKNLKLYHAIAPATKESLALNSNIEKATHQSIIKTKPLLATREKSKEKPHPVIRKTPKRYLAARHKSIHTKKQLAELPTKKVRA